MLLSQSCGVYRLGVILSLVFLLSSCGALLGPEKQNETNAPTDEPTAEAFQVVFSTNGGSSIPSIKGVVKGSTIVAPLAPTRDDAIFAGWYKDTELSQPWNFEVDTVSKDLTLFAQWTLATNEGILVTNPASVVISLGTPPTTVSFGSLLTVTALVQGTIESYAWLLDGKMETQKSSTWSGGSTLAKGPHSLAVIVKVEGVLYSQSHHFVVQ